MTAKTCVILTGRLAQWVTVLAAARLAEGLSEEENQNLIAVASAIASQA